MAEVWVPEEYSGSVINLSNNWKRKKQDMGLNNNKDNMMVVKYLISTQDAVAAVGDAQGHSGHSYCGLRVQLIPGEDYEGYPEPGQGLTAGL